VLFIGVNTWSGVKDKEKEKVAEIYRTNSTSEITRWLLHPLSYVPFYAGFLNQAKYFRFNKEESFLYSNNSSHKEEIITVVNNTICYAPCLDLAEGIFVKYDGKNIDVPNRIRVASSTNYCLESLHQWLANYTYDDGKSKNTWENIEPAISGDSVTFCLTKQSTDYPKIER